MKLKIVILFIGLSLSALVATPALAGDKPKRQPPDYVFKWHRVTGDVYLSKRGTEKFGIGTGAGSALAAALPPPANVIVSAGLSLVAARAAWALADGKCIRIKIVPVPFAPQFVPIAYSPSDPKIGRYCR